MTPPAQKILIVAGDPSGDMHGADLIRSLKNQAPPIEITAVGGSLMRAAADRFLFDLAQMGVTGFVEPIRRLPLFFRLHLQLKQFMIAERPAAVVCIDFYGFNRWVLKTAKELNLPTYYYISPQVWASRPGRIQALRSTAGRMLVIFPFEEELYRKEGVPVSFVGHPLLDHLPEPVVRKTADDGTLKVGLLPGSRKSEVRRHLPLFIESLRGIRRNYPALEATVFAAPHLPDSIYAAVNRKNIQIARETDYKLRSRMDLVLTSSGTATLENALLGLPMVVVYRMNWGTYAVARALIRVPYIAMANLLAGRKLVPELIQHDATPARIASEAMSLLGNPRKLERLREELLSLRQKLGGPGASERAARIILEGERMRADGDIMGASPHVERRVQLLESALIGPEHEARESDE